MPKFGKSSRARLDTCHPKLIALFEEVIKEYDCTVLEGHRDRDRQNEMLRTGRSKLGWPKSKHNSKPSIAVDVVPYPINWKNTKRMTHFAGYVFGIANRMGIKLRWGGDWNTNAFVADGGLDDQGFFDLPHFEMVE